MEGAATSPSRLRASSSPARSTHPTERKHTQGCATPRQSAPPIKPSSLSFIL